MFGTPTSAWLSGVQALVIASALLAFGYVLAELFTRRSEVDSVVKLALAFPAIVAFALFLMLLHLASGGRVFEDATTVRTLTLLAAIAALSLKFRGRRRPGRSPTTRRDMRVLGVLMLAAVLVWGLPVFRLLPLAPTTDSGLHSGWTLQLLKGDLFPTATVTGDIPNYYPWLFHGLTAWVSRWVPGGHPLNAFATLQLLHIAGAVAALFACGRQIARRARGGVAAALFGAMSGGIGFFLLRRIDLAQEVRRSGAEGPMKYLGDLLIDRSYNMGFHNLAPPHPRDIAYSLLPAVILFLALGFARRDLTMMLGAGIVAGLTGLIGGEAWIFAFSLIIAAVAFPLRMPRWRLAVTMLVPAVVIYGTWLVPIAVNYFRFGGFVDTTRLAPVVLPVLGVIGGWGVVIPFALWGIGSHFKRFKDHEGARIAGIVLGVALIDLILSSLIPRLLGEGFETLGTEHRYWPFVYLGLVMVAALGFNSLFASLAKRSEPRAVLAGVLTVALAVPSPIIAGIAVVRLDQQIDRYRLISNTVSGSEPTVLEALEGPAGRKCVAAVPAPLSRKVFAYTGHRLVLWQGGTTGENRARIRWKDIYERIPDGDERALDNTLITTGETTPDVWRSAVDKYEVDLVLVRSVDAVNPVFSGYSSTEAVNGERRFVAFQVGSCSD